jgi:hypothetical protein
MVYDVEYQPAEHTKPCPCCGKASLILWRDVYQGRHQCAAMWIILTPHAKDAAPVAYVSFEADADAPAFGLVIHRQPSGVGFGFDHLGENQPCLTREEALAHPRREEVIAIFDAVIPGDAELHRWLDRPGYDA